jgi:hypothetical protein
MEACVLIFAWKHLFVDDFDVEGTFFLAISIVLSVYSSLLCFSYVVVRQFTGSQEVLKRLKLKGCFK